MRKRAALIAAIWLAGVVLVGAGVTAALILVGNGIFGPSTPALSQARVRQELAAEGRSATPSSPASAASGQSRTSAPPPAADATGVKAVRGGTVFASCSAGQVTLGMRTPNSGYEIDNVSPGPGTSASVTFRSGTTEQVVTVRCSGDHPRFTSALDHAGDGDNHGGGGGGRGRGSSGGGGDG